MKLEDEITSEMRLLAQSLGFTLFRNQCGKGKTMDDRFITFGLMPGSADYIGYREIEITPDMVGRKIAQFASVEFKKEGWKESKKPNEHIKQQINWRDRILDAGGIAGFVSCEDDLRNMLTK